MERFRRRLDLYRQHHQECLERYEKARVELAQVEKLQVVNLLCQNATSGGIKPKTTRVKKQKKEPGVPRLSKTPGPKGSPVKVKKRNPWSGDGSDSDSDLEKSLPVIPRETKSQSASASKPKYTFDFSEEQDEGENASANDIMSTSMVTAVKDQANESEIKEHNSARDEDDFDDKDSDSASNQKTMPRPVAEKKEIATIVPSKSVFSDKSNDSGKGRRRKKTASGSEVDDFRPAKKMAKLVGRAHNPSKDENDSQGAKNTPFQPGHTEDVKCFAEFDNDRDDMFD